MVLYHVWYSVEENLTGGDVLCKGPSLFGIILHSLFSCSSHISISPPVTSVSHTFMQFDSVTYYI